MLGEWLLSASKFSPDELAVLADDSGLEVRTLAWAPGVLSARFAALDTGMPGNSSDAANNAKLLRLMASVPLEHRSARFRCVLALWQGIGRAREKGNGAHPDKIFQGICMGQIAPSPSGTGGFGYDPLFIPDGFQQSFAELGEEVKNRISHRARALAAFKQFISTSNPTGP